MKRIKSLAFGILLCSVLLHFRGPDLTYAAVDQILSPLESGTINALAVNPSTSTVLYAGTADAGVFKSTDGGETWT